MVNAADLKSAAAKAAYGFKPRPRHREIARETGDRRRSGAILIVRCVGLNWALFPSLVVSSTAHGRAQDWGNRNWTAWVAFRARDPSVSFPSTLKARVKVSRCGPKPVLTGR